MDALAPFPRGATYYGSNVIRPTAPTNGVTDPYGTSTALEGLTKEFPDIDHSAGSAGKAFALRSNRLITCILVRNVSGVTLQPGMAVAWATGYRGKRVDAYTNTDAQEAAGIVDDAIRVATGVPDDDLFWLIVKGPANVYSPVAGGSTAWVEGATLYALSGASSKSTFFANLSTGTGAAPDEEGRLQAWDGDFSAAETTNGTATKVALNRVAIAMQACSSGITAQRRLVDVVLAR